MLTEVQNILVSGGKKQDIKQYIQFDTFGVVKEGNTHTLTHTHTHTRLIVFA